MVGQDGRGASFYNPFNELERNRVKGARTFPNHARVTTRTLLIYSKISLFEFWSRILLQPTVAIKTILWLFLRTTNLWGDSDPLGRCLGDREEIRNGLHPGKDLRTWKDRRTNPLSLIKVASDPLQDTQNRVYSLAVMPKRLTVSTGLRDYLQVILHQYWLLGHTNWIHIVVKNLSKSKNNQ